MIIKVPEGYRAVSQRGKNLGTYRTKAEAQTRLRQVEMFRHMRDRRSAS